MKFLRVLYLFGLLCPTETAPDNRIYDVIQITFSGDNSYPMFSPDGQSIYFTSRNPEKYGTPCTNVYELNLNDPRYEYSTGLYSSGIGHEERTTIFDWDAVFEHTVISTSVHSLNAFFKNNINKTFTTDDLCPLSKCASPPDSDVDKVCKMQHVEHYDYTLNLHFDLDGQIQSQEFEAENPNIWMNAPIQMWDDDGEIVRNIQIKPDRIHSGSCVLPRGECIYVNNQPAPHFPTGTLSNAVDGLTYNPFDIYNGGDTNERKFFAHAYQESTDSAIANSMNQGVIPLVGSKIFRFTGADNTLSSMPEPFPHNDNGRMTYFRPFSTQNTNAIVATGYNSSTGKKGIYLITDMTVEQLTETTTNADFATLDPLNRYIVFQSDRNGSGQLFLAKFLNSSLPKFPYSPTAPKYIQENEDVMGSFHCYGKPTGKTKVRYKSWAQLGDAGLLLFVGSELKTKCPQIYVTDPLRNDTSLMRKVSSGLHAYSSPNFIGNTTDILYAATLTKKINPAEKNFCRVQVCATGNADLEGDSTLKDLCKNTTREKSLPKESELYIGNQYGVVKKRLTINDVFDGEAAIAPNGKTVVYSSFNGTDYELFRMNLDETGTPPIKITNKYGFEGGVSFSADGKLIAYYASRPRTRTEIANYKLGIEYGFTDIGKTEISIYSFESEKEYVVYPAKETSHSPVFTGPDRMVFVTGFPPDTITAQTFLYGVEFQVDKGEVRINRVKKITDLILPVWDFNFNHRTGYLAFNRYDDTCITKHFNPRFSNGSKKACISSALLVFALLFSKLMYRIQLRTSLL